MKFMLQEIDNEFNLIKIESVFQVHLTPHSLDLVALKEVARRNGIPDFKLKQALQNIKTKSFESVEDIHKTKYHVRHVFIEGIEPKIQYKK